VQSQSATAAAITDDADTLCGLGARNGGVRLVRSSVSLPLGDVVSSRGLGGPEIDTQREAFGRNTLTIATPHFLEMYVEQLLSPIPMFQIFCSVLWLMDEFWQHAVFSVFSVMMLESTTTFQRQRTFNTLHGMCPKPYPLQVYRNGVWQLMSSQDILPGDLFSVFWHPKRRAAPAAVGA
jgi:cation-transporting ATPase 13A1